MIYGDKLQINPITSSFADGLRISRTVQNTGSSSINLGCSRTAVTGGIAGQWTIVSPYSTYTNNPLGLIIAPTIQVGDNTIGLQISPDCSKLTFNGSKVLIGNGTNQQILLGDGTAKPIIYATRTDFITTPQKFVKLCTFNPLLQSNCISVEFQVRGRSGFGLLQFHQITSTAGLTNCNYHFQPNYQYCMQQAYALYFGTGEARTCELWVQLQVWINSVEIDYTNSGTVTAPISNILTTLPVDALPTDYTSMITLTPNLQLDNLTINNAPFTQNGLLKINPTSSDYTEGIRIARSSNGNCSGIYFGCNLNSTSGTMEGQWNIVNTPDGQLQIGVN
ncbi:MAG: hypothetical protein EZS28_042266, partial [Streblomastix strix]